MSKTKWPKFRFSILAGALAVTVLAVLMSGWLRYSQQRKLDDMAERFQPLERSYQTQLGVNRFISSLDLKNKDHREAFERARQMIPTEQDLSTVRIINKKFNSSDRNVYFFPADGNGIELLAMHALVLVQPPPRPGGTTKENVSVVALLKNGRLLDVMTYSTAEPHILTFNDRATSSRQADWLVPEVVFQFEQLAGNGEVELKTETFLPTEKGFQRISETKK